MPQQFRAFAALSVGQEFPTSKSFGLQLLVIPAPTPFLKAFSITHPPTHTYKHIHTNAYIHTDKHTHTNTQTYTRSHTHQNKKINI